MTSPVLPVAALLATIALHAHAACPTDAETALMAARHANLQPAPNPPAGLALADALCGRDNEAGLVVEVRDAAINAAKTPQNALRHVARVYPFIELVDVLVETGGV